MPIPDPTEQFLALWRDLLDRPEIGIRDSFFEAGGSSLQIIEMLWTVSDTFGKKIDHMEFMKDPCIRKLVELLGD